MTKQGRPPRGKKAATKQIAIRVSDAEYRTYTKLAATLEVSVSEMIRIAVGELLDQPVYG